MIGRLLNAGSQRPRHFFRYRAFREGDFDPSQPGSLAGLVRNGIIFIPKVRSFNDPWDSSPGFEISRPRRDAAAALAAFLVRLNGSGSPWERHIAEDYRREIDRFGVEAVLARCHEQMQNLMQSRDVLCLSARGDVPLQWSYYGGGHTGFALCFDAACGPFRWALPVHYSDAYPTIDVDRVEEPGHALDAALLRKARFWRHEVEWRVLASRSGKIFDYPEPQPRVDVEGVYAVLPREALCAIVVGARIRQKDLTRVMNLVEGADPPIALVNARRVLNRFEIDLPGLP